MSAPTPPKGHRQPRQAQTQLSMKREPQNQRPVNLQARAESSDFESNLSSRPTTPPRTPRKVDHHSAPSHKRGSSAVHGDGSRQSSRQRRARDDLVSPGNPLGSQTAPISTGIQLAGLPVSPRTSAAPNTVAYAGPTFHASPAPSALPIPSFYSKSVPVSSGDIRGTARTETNLHESSTPPSAVTGNHQFQSLDSPLDVFFRADREEKARARSASSAYAQFKLSGPFQPPIEPPLADLDSPSASHQKYGHQGLESKSSAGGIFAMELERTPIPGTFCGPAFSTPYSERIDAAKLSRTTTRSIELPSSASKTPLDRSEALKAYLFSNRTPESAETPAAPQHYTFGPNGTSPPSQIATSKSPSHSVPKHEAGLFGARTQMQSPNLGPSQKPLLSTFAAQRCGYSSLRKEVTPTENLSKTSTLYEYNATMPTHSTSKPHVTSSRSISPVPPSRTAVSNTFVAGTQRADLQIMEESLRKILKLESAKSP